MFESSQLLPPNDKPKEYSVSELSASLKKAIETSFNGVHVRGEISGLKIHTSGHAYFALKDENAVLDAICWRGVCSKLSLVPQDGMDVICKGRITTYPNRSKYQIVIDSMELAGQGALLQILEERKRQLAAEGIFAAERKKALPFLPRTIGVVTSPTGAVIRDILHRLEDRFPSRVIVWPVLVQGQGAAEQVASAIQGFNSRTAPCDRPDLLIIARGGGSLEDLWAFNEEVVVRAVASSDIPVISAVGHETDITLIDYAADKRAPTPTAAAEMAVPVRLDLQAMLEDRKLRLLNTMNRFLNEKTIQITAVSRGLPNLMYRLDDLTQRLDDRAERLTQALSTFCERKKSNLEKLSAHLKVPKDLIKAKSIEVETLYQRLGQALRSSINTLDHKLNTASLLLNSYSFHSTLNRGFAILKDDQGSLLTSSHSMQKGQKINILLKDGEIGAEVIKKGD